VYILSVDPSKERVSISYLVQKYEIWEKWSVLMHKLPNSVVNPDHSSQETCVRRSACSRVWHSGETRCAKVKSPEAQSPRVMWLADVTRDDVDTWDVCHVSVS
jgi:hypothetical protein